MSDFTVGRIEFGKPNCVIGKGGIALSRSTATCNCAAKDAELGRLRDALRGVLSAITDAENAGCIEHLDCWDEADERWHAPLNIARAAMEGK
jgi:hypothetical protein